MPPALLVAEGPDRGQRGPAGQPRVALEDARHRRSGEDVLGPLPTVEGDAVLVVVAELVLPPVAVVDERAHRRTGLGVTLVEERDRHVVGVELGARHVGPGVGGIEAGPELRRRVLVEDVGVPHREVATAAVVVTALLAEAVDRVVAADPAPRRPRVVERRVGPVAPFRVGHRLEHHRPVGAVHVDAERVEPQRHDELVRHEPPGVLAGLGMPRHRPVGRGCERVDAHGIRRLRVERPTAAQLEAHDVGAHRVDAEQLAVQPGEEPSFGLLDGVDALESEEVVGPHASTLSKTGAGDDHPSAMGRLRRARPSVDPPVGDAPRRRSQPVTAWRRAAPAPPSSDPAGPSAGPRAGGPG